MNAITTRFKRFGYRCGNVLLNREGIHINYKKAYRLYKEDGLTLKRKRKKRRYEKRGKPERADHEPNSR